MLGSGDGPLIQAELIRLPGGSQVSASIAGDPGIPGSINGGTTTNGLNSSPAGHSWGSDVDIEAFASPIRAVWLEGDDNAFTMLYECEADNNDGCLVDLAGPALQDLLGATPVSAQQGTYTNVVVSTCESEGGYTAYVTASMSLADQAYVTKTSGVLGTDGAAEAVPVQFTGCQRTYPIPTPLVIADSAGQELAFKLYFDIRDLVWASLGGADTQNGWIPSGCAGPMPDGVSDLPYLCAGYPDVAGVVDSETPTLERYRVNDGATLGLIFVAGTDDFIGGFTRRYYTEGQSANPGFTADTPVESFTANGDGTYTLMTFGGSSEGGGPVGHYLRMNSFVRDNHDGMALSYQGSEFSYNVVRLQ